MPHEGPRGSALPPLPGEARLLLLVLLLVFFLLFLLALVLGLLFFRLLLDLADALHVGGDLALDDGGDPGGVVRLMAAHQRLAVGREGDAVSDHRLLLALAQLVGESQLAGTHVPDAQAAPVAGARNPLAVAR